MGKMSHGCPFGRFSHSVLKIKFETSLHNLCFNRDKHRSGRVVVAIKLFFYL